MQVSVAFVGQEGCTSEIVRRKQFRQIVIRSPNGIACFLYSSVKPKHGRFPVIQYLRSVAFLTLIVLGFTMAGQLQAKDAYALTYGDTIQISINGPAAMDKEVMVGSDGTIVFPYFGRFEAVGKTLASLQEEIFAREDLTTIRQVTPDGSEFWLKLRPAELSLDIAEYRPVFVQGAVETPGSLRFSPGLTVRQAIAASGGVLRVNDTDFVQQRKATVLATIEQARSQIQTRKDILRVLNSRLEPNPELAIEDKPARQSQLALVIADLQSSRDALLEEERTANRQVQSLLTDRLETLDERRKEEETLVLLNQERVARNRALTDRGLMVEDRRNEAERALSTANVRAFETDDDLARVQIESARISVQDNLQSQKSKLSLLEQIERLELEVEDLSSLIAARELELRELLGFIDEANVASEFVFYLYSAATGALGERVTPDARMAPGDVLDIKFKRE